MDTKWKLLFVTVLLGVFVCANTLTSTEGDNSTETSTGTSTTGTTGNTETTTTTVTTTVTTTTAPTTTNGTTEEPSTGTTSTTFHTTQTPLPTFGGFEYLFNESYPEINFEQALDSCKSWGGDLVSIHSQEENDFVKDEVAVNYNGTAWIGLDQKEDSYNWTDGSPVDFFNNLPEQPKENSTTECYVFLSDGNWQNVSCDSSHTAYICKQLIGTTPEPTTADSGSKDDGSGGLSDGAVIAIAAALILLVIALSLGAVLFFIKKKRRPKMDAFTLLDNDQCDFVNSNTVTIGDSY